MADVKVSTEVWLSYQCASPTCEVTAASLTHPKKLLMYLICECLLFVFSIEKRICGNVRHYLWIFTSQCHRVHAGPFYECLQFVQNIKSCAHVSCCAKGFP